MAVLKLTLDTFEMLLDARNRAEPIGIVTLTIPDMNKGGRRDKETGKYPNPYIDRVVKLCRRPVWLGCDYERSVNLQRERENQPLAIDGSLEYFHAEELWCGKGEMLNKYIARHIEKLELYVAVKPQLTKDGNVVVTETQFINPTNNKPYSEKAVAEIKSWIPERTKAWNQEVDKDVKWNVIKLCNVKFLTIGGVVYEVNIESQEA